MKIKYLAGKLKDQVADVANGQELVDGGYAEAVVEKTALDSAIETFETKVQGIAESVAEKTAQKTLEKISNGIKSKPTIHVGPDGWENDPAGGFKGIGDYLSAVIKAGRGNVDERILKYNAKVTFTPMSDASDGSIVPVEYSDVLINDIVNENDFMSEVFKVPVTVGNSIVVPCDNTISLSANGGVAAQLIGEGTQIQDQAITTRNVTFVLSKLGTLIDVTDELLADTNIALPAYLSQKNETAFAYAFAGGILNGLNTPAFTGILGASGTIVAPPVPAEVTAAVPIISYKDLLTMYASFYSDKKNAAWVMGPDSFAGLMNASDGSGRNIFLPVLTGGLEKAPVYTILGIPVIISHVCAAYGTVGDIFLVDLSRYFVAMKGGMQSASTNALRFDYDSYTFRSLIRVCGKPERVAAITTAGGLSLSPYVVLGTRA